MSANLYYLRHPTAWLCIGTGLLPLVLLIENGPSRHGGAEKQVLARKHAIFSI